MALSSINDGTYATAMKDMNADPKNCETISIQTEPSRGGTTHNSVDERLNALLISVEPEPHRAHHDCQAHVHRKTDPVGDNVSVALDEGPMQQCHDLSEHGRALMPVGADWLSTEILDVVF